MVAPSNSCTYPRIVLSPLSLSTRVCVFASLSYDALPSLRHNTACISSFVIVNTEYVNESYGVQSY